MADVLDYGYEHVVLSEALSDTEYNVLGAAGATLTGATFSSNTLAVGGQSVTAYDIKEQCIFIRDIERSNTQDVTTVDADVMREVRTPPRIEIPAEFALDDENNGVNGLIYKDRAGHRVLHIETTESQKWTGVVDIFDVERLRQQDARGVAIISVLFRNSGRTKPKWE